VDSAEGVALAQENGLKVVENRCPKIEMPRLGMV
jgi:predicted CoA-binding protein